MTSILLRSALSLVLTVPAVAQSGHVEIGRLLEPVPESGSTQGDSVGFSAGRIAVGDSDPTRTGQVFTYTTSNGLWQYDATAIASDGANGDRFGGALAIDNDTLVVGAWTADVSGFSDAGAAYVFARSGANWVQQQKFVPGVPRSQGQFGYAVAVSGDTLAIGGPQVDVWSMGEVDVYQRVGATWVFQQKLIPTGLSVGARAGYSIALEGSRMVVGAPHQAIGADLSSGQAFVFERVAGTWTQVAVLTSPGQMNSGVFGESLALDGNRLAVGAIGEPITNSFWGRVHVFTGAGPSWSLEQTLEGVGTSTQNCSFGDSLALSGTRLVVGAPFHNNPLGLAAGSLKVFERSGSVWTERFDLYGATASFNDQLGVCVAMEGDVVVGGAPNGDVQSVSTRGEAYVFRIDPPSPEAYCLAKVASPGCLPSIGWSGTPSVSANAPFQVTATAVVNKKMGMLFYGGLYNQAPFQGGTLCVAPPIKRTTVMNSGGSNTGNNCTGQYSFDFNALVQGGSDPSLTAGKWVYAQYWFRDPASPSQSGLTNAVRFLIEP